MTESKSTNLSYLWLSWPPVTGSVPQCRKHHVKPHPQRPVASITSLLSVEATSPNCSSVITKSLKMGDFYGK